LGHVSPPSARIFAGEVAWYVPEITRVDVGARPAFWSDLLSQLKPEATSGAPQEYPLMLENGVTAGKTAVGTRVQGKLSMATLLHGKVVPRNAPEQPASRSWNRQGQYPDASNSKVYRPFPGTDPDDPNGVPSTASQVPSYHRVPLQNIESERADDGGLVLVSRHGNIKLDKFTTYIFAAAGLLPSK